jgi:hypothetical protein
MMVGLWFAGALLGCGASPGDRPLTAQEREQAMRAAQAEALRGEVGPSRCGSGTEMSRLQGRMSKHAGADGFDGGGCPPPAVAAPTLPAPPR